MEKEVLTNLAKVVKEYDVSGAERWARKAMEGGIEPLKALDALTEAIREVGDAFGAGECFLPELVGATDAMQAAMPIVEEVHNILFEGKSPERATADLMLREPKPEVWGGRGGSDAT